MRVNGLPDRGLSHWKLMEPKRPAMREREINKTKEEKNGNNNTDADQTEGLAQLENKSSHTSPKQHQRPSVILAISSHVKKKKEEIHGANYFVLRCQGLRSFCSAPTLFKLLARVQEIETQDEAACSRSSGCSAMKATVFSTRSTNVNKPAAFGSKLGTRVFQARSLLFLFHAFDEP